jgi:ATP adenylyltransferase/5',5'''-P-1,P-4-tetraphosphate phosphorylase II
MMEDYYRTLLKRVVEQASDNAGGFTETTSDEPFTGYVAELSGAEVLRNSQLGNMATLELFTKAVLSVRDRVADGAKEYEVVWKYENFHLRYLLKQVK